jgi:hypothetical protein
MNTNQPAARWIWISKRQISEHHSAVDAILSRNHDRHAGDAPPAWGLIDLSPSLVWLIGLSPAAMRASRAERAILRAAELAGHLHPA